MLLSQAYGLQRASAAQRAQGHPVRPSRSTPRCLAALQAEASPSNTTATPAALWVAKQRLLQSLQGTARGGEATKAARGEVEEAQVAVEAWAGPQLEYDLLEGKWRLEYTTARDVLPLVRPPRSLGLFAPLKVGSIYQRFSSLAAGRVENIIELAAALAPVEGAGAAVVVEAAYEPRTGRSIALRFESARLGDVRLSPALQNLVASPLLPRGWWNLQALLWLRELTLRVPLLSRPPALSSSQPSPVGFNYLLTYLDQDMLIGRAQGNGGTFIFTREVEEGGQQQGQGQEDVLIL